MCRYDLDGRPVGLWEAQLEERLKDYDALVVSDYQKGMAEIAFAKMAQFCKYPTFVDTKAEQPHRYYLGVDFIFPNAKEWGTWPIEYRLDKLFKHVIHKVGENGCFVDGEHIPTVPIHGADTVGVGDTFLAAFVMEYLSHEGQVGKDGLVRCAKVANKAAGIACSKKGTAVVSLEEFL
jgi:sugar/nucleoside kinase (ribokinase family)